MWFDEFCVKTFHQETSYFGKIFIEKPATAEILLGVRVIFRSLSGIFVSFETVTYMCFPQLTPTVFRWSDGKSFEYNNKQS